MKRFFDQIGVEEAEIDKLKYSPTVPKIAFNVLVDTP